MVKVFNFILDFLFPAVCPLCKESVTSHGMLCSKCWKNIHWISNPKCFKCGYPFPANIDLDEKTICPSCFAKKSGLDFVRSVCVYDDNSKKIILPFKYASKFSFNKFLSSLMLNSLNDLDLDIDVVLPVPLSWRRLFFRGYNQATLLARPLAKYYKAKLDVDSVYRFHKTDMGHKNTKQRYENIHGVFKVKHNKNIQGKNILLVDDVMTSGATFYELCRVLRKAGAKHIYAVSFCRVVRAI